MYERDSIYNNVMDIMTIALNLLPPQLQTVHI